MGFIFCMLLFFLWLGLFDFDFFDSVCWLDFFFLFLFFMIFMVIFLFLFFVNERFFIVFVFVLLYKILCLKFCILFLMNVLFLYKFWFVMVCFWFDGLGIFDIFVLFGFCLLVGIFVMFIFLLEELLFIVMGFFLELLSNLILIWLLERIGFEIRWGEVDVFCFWLLLFFILIMVFFLDMELLVIDLEILEWVLFIFLFLGEISDGEDVLFFFLWRYCVMMLFCFWKFLVVFLIFIGLFMIVMGLLMFLSSLLVNDCDRYWVLGIWFFILILFMDFGLWKLYRGFRNVFYFLWFFKNRYNFFNDSSELFII